MSRAAFVEGAEWCWAGRFYVAVNPSRKLAAEAEAARRYPEDAEGLPKLARPWAILDSSGLRYWDGNRGQVEVRLETQRQHFEPDARIVRLAVVEALPLPAERAPSGRTYRMHEGALTWPTDDDGVFRMSIPAVDVAFVARILTEAKP